MAEAIGYVGGIGPLQVVGVAGFACYLLAFASVQLGRMDGNGAAYAALNVLAAALVGASLFAEFNLSSALIQGSWIVVGTLGLLRHARRRPARDRRAGAASLGETP